MSTDPTAPVLDAIANLYGDPPEFANNNGVLRSKYIVKYPGHLGGAADRENNAPFVIFAPYTRAKSDFRDQFGSIQDPDTVLDRLPPAQFNIVLPLPVSALNTKYGVTYEPFELGAYGPMINTGVNQTAVGAIVGGSIAAGVSAVAKAKNAMTAAAIAKIIVGGAGVGASLASLNNMDYLSRVAAQEGLNQIDPAGVAGKIAAKGVFQRQLNPFTEHLFKDVELREHTFNYTFAPKNEAESKIIDKIIQTFKFYMLPAFASGTGDMTTALLSFPYEFQIYISVQDTTFQMLPSILQSVNVAYSQSTNTPTFFVAKNKKRYPAEISMTLSFKETLILTRQRIDADPLIQSADSANSANTTPRLTRTYRF